MTLAAQPLHQRPMEALSDQSVGAASYWMDSRRLSRSAPSTLDVVRVTRYLRTVASRQPRKLFGEQSTDFRMRNPGTLCQCADRPLVPCGLLAVIEIRHHECPFADGYHIAPAAARCRARSSPLRERPRHMMPAKPPLVGALPNSRDDPGPVGAREHRRTGGPRACFADGGNHPTKRKPPGAARRGAAPLTVFYVVETTRQGGGEHHHRVSSHLFETNSQAQTELARLYLRTPAAFSASGRVPPVSSPPRGSTT